MGKYFVGLGPRHIAKNSRIKGTSCDHSVVCENGEEPSTNDDVPEEVSLFASHSMKVKPTNCPWLCGGSRSKDSGVLPMTTKCNSVRLVLENI